MSEDSQTLFVYHTDQRRRLRGCMPFFVFVSAILVVGGILLVPVRLPEKPATPRTGRVYFRNDPLLHFNMRQLSPRPFELPKFVDPATKNFGRVDVSVLPESRLLRVDPPSPFDGRADTFVLGDVDLLALPPEPVNGEPEQPAESIPVQESPSDSSQQTPGGDEPPFVAPDRSAQPEGEEAGV